MRKKPMDPVVVQKLMERYGNLHPLVLHRSVERARTVGELFDILEGFPVELPAVWDEVSREWTTCDLLLTKKR